VLTTRIYSMNITPEWASAIFAAMSVAVSIWALIKGQGAANQVNSLKSEVTNLTSQVSTLTAELNKVSSSTKDSDIKQVNKGGSGNRFIGGSYNERS